MLPTKKDVIIIAGGGVRDEKTAEYYKNSGADHISASTLFFNPFLSTMFYFNYIYGFNKKK